MRVSHGRFRSLAATLKSQIEVWTSTILSVTKSGLKPASRSSNRLVRMRRGRKGNMLQTSGAAMQTSLIKIFLIALSLDAFAFKVPAELVSIQKEVQATMAREKGGYHNGKFTSYFDRLQARFKKPKSDDDWHVDPYFFVGAQRIIVDRATLSAPERNFSLSADAYLVF